MRFLGLFLLFVLMIALQSGGVSAAIDPLPRAMLVFGFLLLAGFVAGSFAARFGLPHITGYLLAGIICGPYVLGLVTHETVLMLAPLDHLALALIAFTAGGELRLARLRACGKTIVWITLLQTIGAFVVGAAGMFLALRWMQIDLFGGKGLLIAAIFFGVMAVANSPATVIAVIVETRAHGRLSDITIGVTVIKDVLVLLGFALAIGLGTAWFSGAQVEEGIAVEVLISVGASFLVGAVVAALVAVYLRFVRREFVLFTVVLSLVIVTASEQLHLHFLLVCLTAGFLVENFTRLGPRMVAAIERTSTTVYIVFFALAGAALNIAALERMWPVAVLFVVLRLSGTALGTWAGARIGGEGPLIRRWGFMGFIGQAGVSVGIAGAVAIAFPTWGVSFRTVMLASIAIGQIIGPVAFKFILGRAGETAAHHIREGIVNPWRESLARLRR